MLFVFLQLVANGETEEDDEDEDELNYEQGEDGEEITDLEMEVMAIQKKENNGGESNGSTRIKSSLRGKKVVEVSSTPKKVEKIAVRRNKRLSFSQVQFFVL